MLATRISVTLSAGGESFCMFRADGRYCTLKWKYIRNRMYVYIIINDICNIITKYRKLCMKYIAYFHCCEKNIFSGFLLCFCATTSNLHIYTGIFSLFIYLWRINNKYIHNQSLWFQLVRKLTSNPLINLHDIIGRVLYYGRNHKLFAFYWTVVVGTIIHFISNGAANIVSDYW